MMARSDRESGLDALTDSQLWRIDQICDGFECAWRSGRQPRISTILEASAPPDRDALLRELILIEVDLRRRSGETPGVIEYHRRFPDVDWSWLERQLTHSPSDPGKEPQTAIPGRMLDGDPPDTGHEFLGGQPRSLGHFNLLERVGVGGFGTVWRAMDTRLSRIVALKVPHAHLIESGEEMARFYREARAIAQLRHPGIVTVHEVAVLDGLPILVCDFVTGQSLREVAAARRLGARAVAALLAKLAEAMAYAHSMGSIHRDLKPANIMLAPVTSGVDSHHNGDDSISAVEPRIVDFGLAYLDQESIHLTHNGTIIGTPAYMSPEQAAGLDSSRPIDHRTDLYSLGVILYELLTGTIPFTGTRHEVLDRVIHSEPLSPRRLVRSIPRDLESICLKAMAKEPRDRYESARELADDLRHFLEYEPVRARPINLWQKCLRRSHRRPAEAGLLLMGIVTLLTMTGLAIGSRYHLRLQREFRATEIARNAADQERRRAESFLYFHRMALAEREWSANNIDRVDRLLDDCPPSLRGWEWRYLKRQCHQNQLSLSHARSTPQSWSVTCVKFSPDGRALASASKDGTVRLWDSITGRLIRLLGQHRRSAFALAYQPGSTLLASAGEDGEILIWDTRTGSLIRTIPAGTDTIYAMAYSPDGRLLVTGHGYPPLEEVDHMRGRGTVRLWEPAAGRPLQTLRGHTQNVMGLAFSPDGRMLASVSGSWLTVPQAASKPGELILWETESGKLIHKIVGHGGPLTGVAYHPSNELIATSSWDRTIKLWDAETGEPRQSLVGHRDWVLHVEFSPDGNRLASAGADGAIMIWDPRGDTEPMILRGHTQNVTCVTFSPDGAKLASTSSDQTVKLWNASLNPEVRTWRAEGPIARIAFFPDGRRLLVGHNIEDQSGRIHPRLTIVDTTRAMSAEATVEVRAENQRDCPIDGIAVRPDGECVAAASISGLVEAWTLTGGRQSRFRYEEPRSRFQAVAFSPDGRILVAGGQSNAYQEDGEASPNVTTANCLVIAFDLETGETCWRMAGDETGLVRDLAFSPDGRTVASADNNATVTLRESRTGRIQQHLRGHRRLVSQLAFSPDGSRLASASWDSTAIVWDLMTGKPVATLQGHMRSVRSVAFSADGRRLATSSEDQTVRLWDAETGQEVLMLRGHSTIVPSVAFSADGIRLATGALDGVVQVREAIPLASEPPALLSSTDGSTGR